MEKTILKDIVAKLNSSDEKIVLKTVSSLAQKGKIDLMPLLFDLFFSTDNINVKTALNQVFDNAKDPKAVPFFIDAIQKYWDKENLACIVSACWQNGLDFSNHLATFLDLILEKKLEIALEAFTVIEENKPQVSDSDCQLFIARLKENSGNTETQFLRIELIKVLETKTID